MVIEDRYTQQPRATASFDWADFVQGVGYITLYPIGSKDTSGNGYALTTQELDAHLDVRSIVFTATQDQDFDIGINVPFTIENFDVIISYSMTKENAVECNLSFTLYRVRDGNEVQIGTADSEDFGTGAIVQRNLIKFTATRTTFTPGDKLRLTIGATFTAGTSNDVVVYIDPGTRDTLTEDSSAVNIPQNTILNIPVKINQ